MFEGTYYWVTKVWQKLIHQTNRYKYIITYQPLDVAAATILIIFTWKLPIQKGRKEKQKLEFCPNFSLLW